MEFTLNFAEESPNKGKMSVPVLLSLFFVVGVIGLGVVIYCLCVPSKEPPPLPPKTQAPTSFLDDLLPDIMPLRTATGRENARQRFNALGHRITELSDAQKAVTGEGFTSREQVVKYREIIGRILKLSEQRLICAMQMGRRECIAQAHELVKSTKGAKDVFDRLIKEGQKSPEIVQSQTALDGDFVKLLEKPVLS